MEVKRRPLPNYIEKVQKDVSVNMRGVLVDWLVEVSEEYNLLLESLYFTISYIDRYLSLNMLNKQRLQLLGVAGECMRTRSSSNLIPESSTISKRHNHRRSKQIVKPEIQTILETPIVTMADTRTMSELLQAPTEGYEDAIVIPAILAENFELKVRLLQLVTSSQFHGFERDDPHSHIRWFNKITSMLKYKNVSLDAIKLMLFPFSLEGAAQIWIEKEPPHSILTWEDLISKFVNYFFPPSKTTNLKSDITNFQQKFEETFSEA
ncbi:reverse transcriptase domain-containing protein [Tanacetum coccineum]